MDNKEVEKKNTIEEICNYIRWKRESFEAFCKKYNAPQSEPVLLVEHPTKLSIIQAFYIDCNVFKLPDTIKVQTEEVFMSAYNIHRALEKDIKNGFFFLPENKARIIHLKEEVTIIEGMEELWSSTTLNVEQSKFLPSIAKDDNINLRCTCAAKFLVDFSVILPDNIISTMRVTCPGCSQYCEFLLPTDIEFRTQLIKDINLFIGRMDYCGDPDNKKSFTKIPALGIGRKCSILLNSFLGVKPLASSPLNPKLYVKVHLSYTIYKSSILNDLHTKWKGKTTDISP